MKKRICILYTGGTLGMRQTAQGYVPEEQLDKLLAETLPSARYEALPAYELMNMPRRIDSANIQPADWQAIAQTIQTCYPHFDGFIVLHGTDTMAYTASALSFMLRGLTKPVILTGSQIPLRQMRNDAQNNLMTALMLAAEHPLPEVMLYFNGHLLRGNRSTKISADGFDAFASPNYPALGTVGIRIEIDPNVPQQATGPENFQLPDYPAGAVVILRLFPGLSPDWLRACLQTPVRGVIMQAYGVGNAPVASAGFLQVLEQARQRGILIVSVSQCLEGTVDLQAYATGSALAERGVISGLDMTTEAAFCKLNHLLALGLTADDIRTQMTQNLCGECTPGIS